MPITNSPSSVTTTIRQSEDLGKLVRQLRAEQGLLQIDLAGLAGTGNRFIVDLERGKPTLQLQKVLDVLDLIGLEVVVRRKGATAMVSDGTLTIYHDERHVGWLYDTQPLRFEYASEWLEHSKAVGLSPSLPPHAAGSLRRWRVGLF
ncbi:hypothetical protein HSBAA_11700 [Vreelandella sulfidaeris]|uniref:HTH cro/C1-type domain-containing protein n=1 Tax=Vreelandella sulfidaeris TaxID=115553 RepID=A0A455U8W1_9GAMM|nr:hypothetical protein HSBAA_11700 [Halomonas sulfidaeris]